MLSLRAGLSTFYLYAVTRGNLPLCINTYLFACELYMQMLTFFKEKENICRNISQPLILRYDRFD